MDDLRASHRVHCRFGVGGGHEEWVRWYPCVPGALPVPFAHAFLSGVWEGDHDDEPPGPGMLYDWEARSNNFPDAPPGQHVHGLQEWWEKGLPEEAFALTGDALPPRDCEAFVALDVQDIDSTGLLADYVDCSILQFDRDGRIKVEVGHTVIQQVVRWMGASVGVDGGSLFDGVFNILFSGATVDVVDSNTVLVSVTSAVEWPAFVVAQINSDTTVPGSPRGILYRADCSTGPITLTLPAVTEVFDGDWLVVKKIDNSANALTLAAGSGSVQTIDDVPAFETTLDTQHEWIWIVARQIELATIEWSIVAKGPAPGSGATIGGFEYM